MIWCPIRIYHEFVMLVHNACLGTTHCSSWNDDPFAWAQAKQRLQHLTPEASCSRTFWRGILHRRTASISVRTLQAGPFLPLSPIISTASTWSFELTWCAVDQLRWAAAPLTNHWHRLTGNNSPFQLCGQFFTIFGSCMNPSGAEGLTHSPFFVQAPFCGRVPRTPATSLLASCASQARKPVQAQWSQQFVTCNNDYHKYVEMLRCCHTQFQTITL